MTGNARLDFAELRLCGSRLWNLMMRIALSIQLSFGLFPLLSPIAANLILPIGRNGVDMNDTRVVLATPLRQSLRMYMCTPRRSLLSHRSPTLNHWSPSAMEGEIVQVTSCFVCSCLERTLNDKIMEWETANAARAIDTKVTYTKYCDRSTFSCFSL